MLSVVRLKNSIRGVVVKLGKGRINSRSASEEEMLSTKRRQSCCERRSFQPGLSRARGSGAGTSPEMH